MILTKLVKQNKEKGTAMALALLFSVILLGVGLALVYMTYMEELTSTIQIQGSQAFYPADVETSYMAIGRNVVSAYSNWSTMLGLNATDTTPNTTTPPMCNLAAPATGDCNNEIAHDYKELQDSRCKGRILRVPTSPDPGWNLHSAAGNPFGLECNNGTSAEDARRFCNCQMVMPTSATNSRRLPQRISLYVRNDIADDTVLQDKNGEIQLIAVCRMPSLLVEGSVASTIIAYDLTAWTQSSRIYDIHQTGSVQTAP